MTFLTPDKSMSAQKRSKAVRVLSWIIGAYYFLIAFVEFWHSIKLFVNGMPFLSYCLAGGRFLLLGIMYWLFLQSIAAASILCVSKNTRGKKAPQPLRLLVWLKWMSFVIPLLLIGANVPSWMKVYVSFLSFGISHKWALGLTIITVAFSTLVILLFFYTLLESIRQILVSLSLLRQEVGSRH